MKRKILLLASALMLTAGCIVGYTRSTKSDNDQTLKQEQREERHIAREKARAQRLAEYERSVDSMVLARSFRFNPTTMQQQPAGSPRLLTNPAFLLSVWDSVVDVCLPFIKGVTPPYYTVILNYTLPSVTMYTTEQTREGWLVTFSSTLFSATQYNFSLEIYSSSGSATLTISTSWYPDVQYSGSITGLN